MSYRKKLCVKTFEVCKKIEKVSSWTPMVRAFTVLRRVVRKKLNLPPLDTVHMNRATELFLVNLCQNTTFAAEITNLAGNKPVPKDSCLRYLNPYLHDEIIRLGRRVHTGDGHDEPIVCWENL